jgi:hypothetical protein
MTRQLDTEVMRPLLVIGLLAVVLSIPSAWADSSQPVAPHSLGIAGVVPVRGSQSNSVNGSGQLTYHGGPVMHTNTTYAIFWVPPGYSYGDSHYTSVIKQWLTDVAHDSGGTRNVYSIDAQYYDTTGGTLAPGAYDSTFGGSAVISDPLPSSDCSDSATRVCLSDSKLETEVQHVIQEKGWPEDAQTLYFLFTPPGVGSCAFDLGCAFTKYCAYHSAFWDTGPIIWANMPDDAVQGCDTGQRPNGSSADATINVASHEHNEAVTDPFLNAWYDADGQEIADKCQWLSFGSVSGSPGSLYNQSINDNHYYMQLEYDNASKSCAQHASTSNKPAISIAWPNSGGAGTPVEILGAGFAGATDVRFNGLPASFTVDAPNLISTVVPDAAATGYITVVTPHGTITSAKKFVVLASKARDVEPGAGEYACALLDGGEVACWGSNQFGQLGDGDSDTSIRPRPVAVSGLQQGAVSIATDGNHSCAVVIGGLAKCWGDNTAGQLGDGTRTNRSAPVTVKGLSRVVQIDPVSDDQTCALVRSALPGLAGGVWCWGSNFNGSLGDGTTTSSLTPVPVRGLQAGIAQISGTCALTAGNRAKAAGMVVCWGSAASSSTDDHSTVPVRVQGVVGLTKIGGSCGVLADATVECWDGVDSGPFPLDDLEDVDKIGATSSLFGGCALLLSGAVDCWDWDLGVVPIVGLESGVRQVAGDAYQGCAVLDSGKAECWGNNDSGQLGDGTTISSDVPVAVIGL